MIEIDELVVEADTDRLREDLPENGLHVVSFPFAVGRELADREPPPACLIDLAIEDRRPYRLSRQHFRVEQTSEGLAVRDLDSYLGTVADGTPLGTSFRRDSLLLEEGEHLVVAGGTDSPYRFRLTVRRKA